ncbi:MAG: ferrous iron transport protein A, partial [Gloeomargarita sp. SKYG98]|nr:ferrous iron transport protein A [Gloeomargarita sp. SKYG98]
MALHWRERWRQWRNQGRSQAINTGFTYHNDPTAEAPLDKNFSQTLADMALGERVQIQGLPGPSQAKLLSMGLVPGVVVEIASRLPSGSVVVALDGQR